jgi:hypothetical protein
MYSAKSQAEFLQIKSVLGNAVSTQDGWSLTTPSSLPFHTKINWNRGFSNLTSENFTDTGNFPGFLKEICIMKELFCF